MLLKKIVTRMKPKRKWWRSCKKVGVETENRVGQVARKKAGEEVEEEFGEEVIEIINEVKRGFKNAEKWGVDEGREDRKSWRSKHNINAKLVEKENLGIKMKSSKKSKIWNNLKIYSLLLTV